MKTKRQELQAEKEFWQAISIDAAATGDREAVVQHAEEHIARITGIQQAAALRALEAQEATL
jgi:hypothetical protein